MDQLGTAVATTVGQLVAAVDKSGGANHTIIFFSSDNGAQGGGGNNGNAAVAERGESTSQQRGRRDDAAGVLVGLGWRAKAVDKALGSVLDEIESDAPLDEIVRRTLARLMER